MIVYTAIFGNYDKLSYPPDAPKGTKFVCYTDRFTRSCRGWEMRRVLCDKLPRRCSRYYKVMSHVYFPEAEVTIWHGGNVKLHGDLGKLAALVDGKDIAVLRHSQRDCIYDEADACIQFHLDRPEIIRNQVEGYRREGYPAHRGLSTAFLIVRRNTPHVARLNQMWWHEIEQGSVRDQLSLDYCLWKRNINPVTIPGDIYQGPYHTRNGYHK